MNDELLTALRYKSEGTDIDFKSQQYRFAGASDHEKSEMLKDVLAMANAWRGETGYILLGLKDQRPHPAEVVGITESIDDATLQQFVNSKIKPKLTFQYEEHLYEGETIGVITIPKQKRPFFLINSFGKLKKNIVYVRRGSSTDEAEPSEIIDMGLADAGRGFELTNLNAVATGRVLISKGTGTAPAYSATPAVNLVEVTKGMRGDQEPQAGATGAMQDGFKIYASRVQGLTVLYAVFATGIPHPFATQWN